MLKMIISLWVLLLTVCLWAQPSSASSPASKIVYFPTGVFATPTHTFKDKWYAQTLSALREPSLFDLRTTKSIQAYRFLWLPSFHRPISVRLTINSDGSGSVVTRSVDRHMGLLTKPRSDTRKLILDTTGTATKEEVDNVMKQLESIRSWSMTTEESPQGFQGAEVKPGYSEVPVPKLDGAGWILEGLREGEYHVVDRQSPKNDSYSQLCRYLAQLGKVDAALY